MLLHCCVCHKARNPKRMHFPGEKVRETIKGSVKTESITGYYCRSCAKRLR